MAFEAIQKNKASELVAEQIIKQINSGELVPGNQLPSQRELSELLGVGRSSVREAINALSVMGYLEVNQGKGTFIRSSAPAAQPSIHKLQSALKASNFLDLKEVQELLECRSAELAVERADEKQIKRLKAALEKMKSCTNNFQMFLEADRNFHLILAESTENALIYEIEKLILEKLFNFFSTFETKRFSRSFYKDTISSFEKAVSAIEQKDPGGASKWVRYHVRLPDKELKYILKT
jgi:GntR family transcriptional repressor for pyruvate dehydrogenase complex